MQENPIDLRARAHRWRLMALMYAAGYDEQTTQALLEAADALDRRALEIERAPPRA